MTNQKGILFLGSGATRGSGIRKNNFPLPVDSQFFESPLVTSLLEKRKCRAIKLVRNLDPFTAQPSLFRTWHDLFIYRGLAHAEVIEAPDSTLAEFNVLNGRDAHYKRQFTIKAREAKPLTYYLAELAIWDLRVLVKAVYQHQNPQSTAYEKFWRGIGKKISRVVNLNYDTTFDDVFAGRGQFYSPSKSAPTRGKKPLIRPHGSLKWTSKAKFKVSDHCVGWWPCKEPGHHEEPWHHSEDEETTLERMGYRGNLPIFDFSQQYIVSPAMFKEEVVGSSAGSGLGELLRHHWLELRKGLEESDHWIFVGISFASGDDHLVFLLRLLYGPNKYLHCSCYDEDHACRGLKRIFGEHANICAHPIRRGQTIDSFLPRPGCPLSTSLAKG